MRVFFYSACLVVSLGAFGLTQSLAPPAATLQHVVLTPSSSPASLPTTGGAVSLYVDVAPKPGVHVYALGAKDFMPVAIVITPRDGLTILRPRYPAGIPFITLGATRPVPVYRETFRITQPITLARQTPSAREVIVAGVVNYQACDETICYPTASRAVLWRLPLTSQ